MTHLEVKLNATISSVHVRGELETVPKRNSSHIVPHKMHIPTAYYWIAFYHCTSVFTIWKEIGSPKC